MGQEIDDDRDSSTKARSCNEREGRGKAGRTGWPGVERFVSRVEGEKEEKRRKAGLPLSILPFFHLGS